MIEIVPNWHPVLVHFTIAPLLLSVAAFLAAAALPAQKPWRGQALDFAHWNLRLGYLFALVTAWLGWLAYNSVAHDDAGHVAMTAHRDAAMWTLALFAPFFVASWFRQRIGRGLGLVLALAVIVPGAALVRTGWLGGEAVFRHGLGVERLPVIESDPVPIASPEPAAVPTGEAPAKAEEPAQAQKPAADGHRHTHKHNHKHNHKH